MFCNKPTVNILTSALLANGISDVVACPGSRNAVILHNLNECAQLQPGQMHLHPVTDERSAVFVAIGIWLKTRCPVAVCVTSGSALLNLLPGVAEAYYRHIPLVILSADRPAEWIGQLDGQTLPQPDALLPYAKCWNLSEEANAMAQCDEAIHATKENGGQPVHLNIPLAEPLFGFSTQTLPDYVSAPTADIMDSAETLTPLMPVLQSAKRPALIIGQWEEGVIPALRSLQAAGWTVFAENISNQGIYNDTLPDPAPDLLVHIGGALVEKRLKLQLRALTDLTVIRIDETDECPATFGHVEHKIKGHPATILAKLCALMEYKPAEDQDAVQSEEKPISPRCDNGEVEAFFVANSTAVRWANHHLRLPLPTYCNRGVNGIEGSLSVAAGYSLVTDKQVFCLIGDLSFFYDVNALWNQRLRDNLRILLINNNKGGIFYRLPGLSESPALDDYIAARHNTGAQGIAQSYGCTYLTMTLPEEDHTGFPHVRDVMPVMDQLLNILSDKPVIYEITLS